MMYGSFVVSVTNNVSPSLTISTSPTTISSLPSTRSTVFSSSFSSRVVYFAIAEAPKWIPCVHADPASTGSLVVVVSVVVSLVVELEVVLEVVLDVVLEVVLEVVLDVVLEVVLVVVEVEVVDTSAANTSSSLN